MTRTTKDLYSKALLMAVLAGAVIGAAHAETKAQSSPMTDVQMMAHDSAAIPKTPEQRSADAAMLMQTLSEEFTEVRSLAAQQAKFRQVGDWQSTQIARIYGRMIRDHKAGVPMLAALIRANGGDPSAATELKNPVLGTKMLMLHATAMDHEGAIKSSQQRFGETDDVAIRYAMHHRANVAREHLMWLSKFHNPKTCPVCAQMMHTKM